jgi:hypothetical protein
MMAAVLATVLAMAPHTVSAPAPVPALPQAVAATSTGFAPDGLRTVAASAISTRLAPETPGCAEMGLAGRLSLPHTVAAELPRYGGPKQQARPRLENPLVLPQSMRPAMHMCVVDQFSPQDPSGAHKTVYHL